MLLESRLGWANQTILRLAIIALSALWADASSAQPELDAELVTPSQLDEDFGPRIVIEDIVVVGNQITATKLIMRALPFAPGDSLRAGDPRLTAARYKVLALGFFRTVALKLEKGSRRGLVVLTVLVVERGTVVLDRLHFGYTDASPGWGGVELSERNLFGTGLGLGGGFLIARAGGAEGAEGQWAGLVKLDDSSILGSRWGAFATLSHIDASEPYRVRGPFDDGDIDNFAAFGYRRTGGRAGATLEVTPLSQVIASARFEHVRADVPGAPIRENPDGSFAAIELHLKPDTSRVSTLSIGFERDSRANPILPWNGSRIVALAELGGTWIGGSYNYASALGRYSKWWPISGRGNVLSLSLTGGLVLGDAPLFDRLFVGDLSRLLTPRELGLVLSTRETLDIFGNRSNEQRYGEIGAVAEVQYSRRLWRHGKLIYGGDVYVGLGLWGMGVRDDLLVRDTTAVRALPIDLFIDAGLRLDTALGMFELSLANGFGRVPL